MTTRSSSFVPSIFVLSLGIASLAATTAVNAKPPIREAFFDAYPDRVNSRLDELVSNANHCGVCHFDFDGGGARNPYGLAVEGTNQESDGILSIGGMDSDGDGFSNDIEIEDSLGQYSNTPTFPGLTAGNVGQTSHVDTSEVEDYLTPVSGQDTQAPTVVVLFPAGGEVLVSSSEQTITWSAIDNSGVVTSINVWVTFDGGASLDPLALGVPNSGSLEWFPQNRPTTQARIVIEAFDASGNMGTGQSAGDFEIESAPGGRVPTTLRDFDMPGTQPLGIVGLSNPVSCQICHGNYDPDVEPYFNWSGSMMAQASYDPLFLAALEVANLDAPESGDLCLRCHDNAGWLGGRSTPTDGSQMQDFDKIGVNCDLCHRLVDPDFAPENPAGDAEILDALELVPNTFTLAQFVIDPASNKRGPFEDSSAEAHPFLYSPFHREAAICGTCHDVSNPVFVRNPDGTYSPNAFDSPATDFSSTVIGTVERTYSEWFYSAFNTPEGVYAPEFGGNKDYVASCQDCHMRDVTGVGCNTGTPPIRDDLPLHDMTGGSTWLPILLVGLNPAAGSEALSAAADRARYMLQNAADLGVEQDEGGLEVTVTNKSGHKLPTGYPEGRRMWLNVRFYDAGDELIKESGAYDSASAELSHDEEARIYEVEPAVSEELGPVVGLPAGTLFHFVLNDTILKDNRIPPLGFTNADYAAFGGAPVGASYADGQNFDEAQYAIPPDAVRVEITLYYQSISREFVEFLRDNGLPNGAGQDMYDLWAENGMSPPEQMKTIELQLEPVVEPCEADANGDGTVDPLDSGYVQARFGCAVGTGNVECDDADVNGDLLVDPLDVGFVLARFGPCP